MGELPLGVTVSYPSDYPVRRFMERFGFVVIGTTPNGECLARRQLYSVGPATLPAEALPPPFRVRVVKP